MASQQRFDRAMSLMRKHDPQLQEDGFDFLREHADAYVDELVAEFAKEHEDHGLRCWLLELIAEARSPEAMPVLVGQLEGTDEYLQTWAIRGLEMLDTHEARQALHRARANGWIS